MTNVAVVEKDVSPLVVQAESISITSPEDMQGAVAFLSRLNTQLDRITTEKERVTKPLNDALKVERSRWKPLETMLDQAISVVRQRISMYQTEATNKAKEAEDKIIARTGEGKGKFTAETAVRKLGEVERAEDTVATDEGVVKFRDKKCFEVVDIAMLPVEYIVPNEVAIRKRLVEGVELPGVRYWVEQTPINFR